MDTPAILSAPASSWLRFAARIGLLAWAGFWTWFIVSVALSEPPAIEPWVGLTVLWAVAGTAWLLPRFGCVVLFAFAGWAAWYFGNDASIWLIAVPAVAVGLLGWLGARATVSRAATAAPGGA